MGERGGPPAHDVPAIGGGHTGRLRDSNERRSGAREGDAIARTSLRTRFEARVPDELPDERRHGYEG